MKLYGTDHSPFAARVRMAAYYKGIALPEVFPPGGPSSPEFRLITPLGMVPALDAGDAGMVIPESEVIVEYLEDEYPTPTLRPDHPIDRARARLLARVADLYLAEPLRELFEHAKAGGDNRDAMRAAARRVRSALAVLDHSIGDQGYAVGRTLSTADCALVPLLFFVVRCTGVLERTDGAGAWHGAARLEPYWQAIAHDTVAARVLRELEASQQRRAAERALTGGNAVR